MFCRELLDQQVLAVAVRVADDDLGRAGCKRTFDRGVDFLRHEFPEACVLEALRTELFVGDDADHAFHVGGDVDLHRSCSAHWLMTAKLH